METSNERKLRPGTRLSNTQQNEAQTFSAVAFRQRNNDNIILISLVLIHRLHSRQQALVDIHEPQLSSVLLGCLPEGQVDVANKDCDG